jgi:hypothetical protein
LAVLSLTWPLIARLIRGKPMEVPVATEEV